MSQFFGEDQNLRIIAAFLKKADASHVADDRRARRLALAREILSYIYKSPEGWDERCTFNIKHIGAHFITTLSNFDVTKNTDIDNLYSMSYRFLCEFDFLVGVGKELSFELRRIKSEILEDDGEFDENTKSQLIYASYFMPANIAKDFINDANIGVFRAFEAKKLEADSLKETWDGEIEAKKAEVDAISQKLEEQKIGFNFVGLYQGFSELAQEKLKESKRLFWSLVGMGILILTPLVTEIALMLFEVVKGSSLEMSHLLILVPLISIEIILIYFFRVVLLNHRATKAQIMQIELRKALCQFIQHYADYSSTIKEKDPNALEKFESLIFSGIISDPGKLPSTFDGMDQIGSFIKNIKSS